MNVILFGMPGAGKGTQAELLVRNLGFSTISTGDLLRKIAKSDNSLGKEVQEILTSGQLVPDNIVLTLINDELDNVGHALFDGFPRTIAQAEALSKITKIDLVVIFDIDENILLDRITGRRIHPASSRVYHIKNKPPKLPDIDDITGEPLIQRDDDKPEIFKKRLESYKKQTYPIIEYYQNLADKPEILTIDASKSPEEIYKLITARISNV